MSPYTIDVLKRAGVKTIIDLRGGEEKQIDGIIGGPPCQGFSRMGLQDVNDERNNLFIKFFKLVNEIKPKFFLAENVLGILDAQNSGIIKKALKNVKKDYTVLQPVILKASDYGVPTTRTRVFFFGYLSDWVRPLTEESLKKLADTGKVSVNDALAGLPKKIQDDFDEAYMKFEFYSERRDYGVDSYVNCAGEIDSPEFEVEEILEFYNIFSAICKEWKEPPVF